MIALSFVNNLLGRLRSDFPVPEQIVITSSLLPHQFDHPIHGRLMGKCTCLGTYATWGDRQNVRVFRVEIVRTLDMDEAILCVLHEYRHVMQYAEGRLVGECYSVEGSTIDSSTWDGQTYIHVRYWDKPWERDARWWAWDHMLDYL